MLPSKLTQSPHIREMNTECQSFLSNQNSISSYKRHTPPKCASFLTMITVTSVLTMSLSSCYSCCVSAFAPKINNAPIVQSSRISTHRNFHTKNHSTCTLTTTNIHKKAETTANYPPPHQLRMSSIDRDPDENNIAKIQSLITSKLPPPPEDELSFYGDIGAIFMYTFIDHSVNGMYEDWLNSPAFLESKSAFAAIESSFAVSAGLSNAFTQSISGNSFPVWFDLTNSAPFGSIPLVAALPISHHITYAPAIDTIGMASVLLTSAWIVCGYFTGAFQLKNTLNCNPSRAILVTGKTWLLTSIVMLLIAYGSDFVVGSFDCLHKCVGLTKVDEDYILDSFTVLGMWRFIISSMLGYGSDDENKD
mmetsp:Transcript_23657/g.27356  ORF Transcript_23657/g.27356 Transcript_23657/m.27356 type:complete len:363 (-) Transcript_23657:72-1160(-)